MRKDAWEIERLRDGAQDFPRVAKCILPKVLAGRTEAEVAAEIEAALRRAGFERPAFDTIVAAGPNAALPHARAGARRIEAGDLVVLDFGGVLDGYCTDLTRTVVRPDRGARERRLIEQVARRSRRRSQPSRAGRAAGSRRRGCAGHTGAAMDWPTRSRMAPGTGWDWRFMRRRA